MGDVAHDICIANIVARKSSKIQGNLLFNHVLLLMTCGCQCIVYHNALIINIL